MTPYTSSLNILQLKIRKQPSNPVIIQDRRIYWKIIISSISNQKGGKTSKAVTTKLKQANKYNLGIKNHCM